MAIVPASNGRAGGAPMASGGPGPRPCVALIVAAGRGSRLGGPLPKQYRDLAGAPVLRHAVRAFLDHPKVAATRLVIHPDDRALYEAAVAGLALLPPVEGGATRQDSVIRGLESLAELRPEAVLIHDAARPFVDRALVDRVLAALATTAGAIPALPVVDTLKRGDGGEAPAIVGTVERAHLWRAQTPQGFHYDAILAAHRACRGQELTDDAAVAERAGLTVALVVGDEANFKITSEEDLARADEDLARRRSRTGIGTSASAREETRTACGYDVHRLGAGDHVMLCGVRVPHAAGLVGHSDADVGLHALTDALLGTIAAGDIGQHFPPTDARWRGADSAQFLAHAGQLVAGAGGVIVFVDVTLVCERPKIGPHRDAMRRRIATILGLDVARISVKATTTERLGFTGRKEGIAAHAVATVRLVVPPSP